MSRNFIPRNELAVGDCLESMAAWPADSVDLIFADPPIKNSDFLLTPFSGGHNGAKT